MLLMQFLCSSRFRRAFNIRAQIVNRKIGEGNYKDWL